MLHSAQLSSILASLVHIRNQFFIQVQQSPVIVELRQIPPFGCENMIHLADLHHNLCLYYVDIKLHSNVYKNLFFFLFFLGLWGQVLCLLADVLLDSIPLHSIEAQWNFLLGSKTLFGNTHCLVVLFKKGVMVNFVTEGVMVAGHWAMGKIFLLLYLLRSQ